MAAAAAKLLQSCLTLCDPIDSSPPGSRQEHWSGLPFPSPTHESEKWKWSRSVFVRLLATPWTAAYQAPLSMGSSRKEEYWNGVPLPSPIMPLNNPKWQFTPVDFRNWEGGHLFCAYRLVVGGKKMTKKFQFIFYFWLFWVFVAAWDFLQLWCVGLLLQWLLLLQSMGVWAQQLWLAGPLASHVESSWTKGQTCVSCIGRWIPKHWMNHQEAPEDDRSYSHY